LQFASAFLFWSISEMWRRCCLKVLGSHAVISPWLTYNAREGTPLSFPRGLVDSDQYIQYAIHFSKAIKLSKGHQ